MIFSSQLLPEFSVNMVNTFLPYSEARGNRAKLHQYTFYKQLGAKMISNRYYTMGLRGRKRIGNARTIDAEHLVL